MFRQHERKSFSESSVLCCVSESQGGVYMMIPGRLSSRNEVTPVSTCGSADIYMISTENVIPERVIYRREFTPVSVPPGTRISPASGMTYQQCHVNEEPSLASA